MYILPPLAPEEVLVYLRKSQSDDPRLTVEEVLEKHEQILGDWMERNLIGKVPEHNRLREVASGETIQARPQMQNLLKRIESPKIKAVLCVEPQRLSRGYLDEIGRLIISLKLTNTIVITPTYSYDLRDDRDRDAFERELKRGNEFLDYQKKIMRRGRELSVENGNYIGSKPPYGYDIVPVKEGKRTCYTLIPNSQQAPIVKLIFEMYRDGLGSQAIARRLNEMGVPTATGSKWVAASLCKMRRNQHYIGKVIWNRRRVVQSMADGEVVTSRPLNDEYIIFQGKHEPLIDMDLWNAVQEIRDKIPPVKNKRKHANEFAGLVYCKKCGKALSRRQYKARGVEKCAPRLICDYQTECHTASCSMDEMREAVAKILKDAIEDFRLHISSNDDSAATQAQLISRLEQRLDTLVKLEIAQWEKYTMEEMPKEVFDVLNHKVLSEKEQVTQALCTARDALPEPIDYSAKEVMFSDALALLQDPDAPPLQKNLLLKRCIERIDYSREKKKTSNRRWGEPEPMELDVHLNV